MVVRIRFRGRKRILRGGGPPSAEDLEITRRLREVGELVGVKVLDHIVIGKGRYVSFVD